MLKITPDQSKILSEFLAFLLLSHPIKRQLRNYSHGLTMDLINGQTLRKLYFTIPSLAEQKRIVDALAICGQRTQAEQNYLSKLQKAKTGLMQDLLAGKVRVNYKD